MTINQLIAFVGFAFLIFAAIFALIGYLEIRRNHADVGRMFLYAALVCGTFLFLIILFLSSNSRPIKILITIKPLF